MNAFFEGPIFPGRNSELSTLYRRYIRPTDVVVDVGPGWTIRDDPSLVLLANMLSNGGKLYIVDPLSQTHGAQGTGNVDIPMTEVKELRKCGMPLAEPTWLGKDSHAEHIPLADHSVDAIVDHNTSLFLMQTNNDRSKEDGLQSIYREYRRILRHGGRLILQTDCARFGTTRKQLENVLSRVGFGVKYERVQDVCSIPITEETFHTVRATASGDLTRVQDGKYFFVREARYQSKDCFIGTAA